MVAEGVLGAVRPDALRRCDPRQARRALYAARGRRRALKKAGALAGRNHGGHTMIVEIGHFALILALRRGARPGTVVPVLGRPHRRRRPDGRRPQRRADPASAGGDRLRRARQRPSGLGLLRPQRRGEFAQRGADDLQDLRRLGKPRRLDAAVGPDPGDLRGACGPVRPRASEPPSRRRARRSGLDQRRFPRLHSLDLEPAFERLSPAPFEGRDLNPILQDPGLGDPSAAALSWLCRLPRSSIPSPLRR